jgi:hypothetical protein
MSSTFGTPTYEGGSSSTAIDPQQATNGVAHPSDAPQDVAEAIDPNDPRLTSEALDVNAEGDAYAQPAPPPDAKYRAKLTLEQVPAAKGSNDKVDFAPMQSKKSPVQVYFATGIKAVIMDSTGKFDGIPLYDRWVGTFIGRDGSTKVSTILARLKRPDGTPWIEKGKKYNHREWIELLVKALAGEPEIGVETAWEWSCQGCGEEAKKAGKDYPKSIIGMQKFPYDAQQRKHIPEMKCQVNPLHGYSRARATIARFLSLSELK